MTRVERPARARAHVTGAHTTCLVAARSRANVLCSRNVVSTSSLCAKSRDASQPREEQLISRLRTAYLVPSRVFLRLTRPPPEEEEPLWRVGVTRQRWNVH